MTNNRVRSGRLSSILLIAAAILSAQPCLVFSQDLESRPPSTLRSQDGSSSVPDQLKKHMPLADDAEFAALPDAPMPQDQAQDESPSSPAASETHLNQFPVLPPGLTRAPLTIQVIGPWSLAPCEGPSGMAIDSERRRLFSVCSRNATLVVFDLESHRVITSLKIGGGPDSVAFDRTLRRIYSAGKAGRLTIIQQDSPNEYRLLDEMRTHYGAHTLVLDPVSHRVFVGYASLFAHPRIGVFSPMVVNDVREGR